MPGERRGRRKFSEEFKHKAVELVRTTGRPIAEVAKELGIYDSTLGNLEESVVSSLPVVGCCAPLMTAEVSESEAADLARWGLPRDAWRVRGSER